MREHPRAQMVRQASSRIKVAFFEMVDEHGLTYVETAQVLAECLQTNLKYALRVERHGDENKPAGLAN